MAKPITSKELALTIKKANKVYRLDLAVTYINKKPRIFRRAKPKQFLSPPNLTLNKVFYWLDAWLKGYEARGYDERRGAQMHIPKKEVPYLLERD